MTTELRLPQRIVFGRDAARQLPALAAEAGTRVLLVTGAHADRWAALTADLERQGLPVTIFRVPHEPTFALARAGAAQARDAGANVVVAIGGGSVLDAGKAIAMLATNGGDPLDYAEIVGAGRPIATPSLPCIAVPTTAGTGAEATRNAVLGSPEHKVKVSLRGPGMLPSIALVDPALACSLPPDHTAAAGMDALSQLIEPYVSCRANPLVDALCLAGVARVARALPRAVAGSADLAAREDMAWAALWSGIALANAGLGAVHGFAGPLGGLYDAPHGALCAALLAPVIRANAAAAHARATESTVNRRYAELARAATGRADADAGDLADWVETLRETLGLPGLLAFGVREDDFDGILPRAQAASSMKANPLPLEQEELRSILREAVGAPSAPRATPPGFRSGGRDGT